MKETEVFTDGSLRAFDALKNCQKQKTQIFSLQTVVVDVQAEKQVFPLLRDLMQRTVAYSLFKNHSPALPEQHSSRRSSGIRPT